MSRPPVYSAGLKYQALVLRESGKTNKDIAELLELTFDQVQQIFWHLKKKVREKNFDFSIKAIQVVSGLNKEEVVKLINYNVYYNRTLKRSKEGRRICYKVKIKIIDRPEKGRWYSNRVGEEFEASLKSGSYFVNKILKVPAEDCTVLGFVK